MSTDERIEPRFDDPSNHASEYPPDWDARRRRTYRRDDYTCQSCGERSGPHAHGNGVPLHAHHVVPKSEGGSNGLWNLRTLCETCHDRAHDHDITATGPTGGDTDSGTAVEAESGAGLLFVLLTFPLYMGAALTLPSALGLYAMDRILPVWVSVPLVLVYLGLFVAYPSWSLRVGVGWVGVVVLIKAVFAFSLLFTATQAWMLLVGVGVPLAVREREALGRLLSRPG